jgi:hypothetical protein
VGYLFVCCGFLVSFFFSPGTHSLTTHSLTYCLLLPYSTSIFPFCFFPPLLPLDFSGSSQTRFSALLAAAICMYACGCFAERC